jgi:Meiotic cell cortex C-terminal pleckstrin homology
LLTLLIVVIQSVLDVRDDTPLPKNHGIAEPFNRSILILTPARALKFTAMSRERHYTWLTALSFLAHSPLLAPGLASLPAPPQEPQELPGQRSRSATLKRGPIRDSVRIAKDRARPIKTPKSDHSQATIPEIEFQAAFGASVVPPLPDVPKNIAAEPPNVPRFAHGRNRSLTGPSRMPTSSLVRTLGYKEVQSPVFPMASLPSPSIDYESGRTSQASTATRSNFLDTVGTIRMEAFIDQQQNFTDYSPEVHSGRRRGNMLHSPAHSDMKRSGMIIGDDFDVNGGGFDPFKDFTH